METVNDTSVAETFRLIKEFEFSPQLGFDVFNEISVSDTSKVTLDGTTFKGKLKSDSDGYYPTDDDLWFMTWTAEPESVRKLLMVDVDVTCPENTSYQVRLYDGTDHYYWDGADWSVAGTSDWNDEGTINANIESFPILPDRKFAVVINLKTTDNEVTPLLNEVKVLMEVWIDYIEDLVYRSLIPLIKANIRPPANLPFPALTQDSLTLDLNDYNFDTNFNIVDVKHVFNWTTDSELLYDLLDSYNPSTKVITLTSQILTGQIPFIVFRYEPEIAYTTNQDYVEVAKVPAIILQRLEVPVATAYNLAAREHVIDKGTGAAVVLHEPWRATLEFRIHVEADKGVDQARLMTAVMKFLDENKTIRSVGLDEHYSMMIVREIRDLISPNRADIHTFWTRFVIQDVGWTFVAEDTHAVQRLILQFKEPASPHEDPVKGGSRVVLTTHRTDGPTNWEETIEVTE